VSDIKSSSHRDPALQHGDTSSAASSHCAQMRSEWQPIAVRKRLDDLPSAQPRPSSRCEVPRSVPAAAGQQAEQLGAVSWVARVSASLLHRPPSLRAAQKAPDLVEDRGHHGSLESRCLQVRPIEHVDELITTARQDPNAAVKSAACVLARRWRCGEAQCMRWCRRVGRAAVTVELARVPCRRSER
jgi:hypothetical protein